LLSTRILPGLALLYGFAVFKPTGAFAQATTEPLPHRLDTAPSFGLPFKLVGGLIVLQQLTLNGQRGDFILDTGNTSALLVERTAFAGQLRSSSHHPTGHGATGTVALQELPVTSFQLGAARYTGFAAYALPLATVQAYVGGQLLGVIGYGLLREYEVVIDYPHRRVSFYSLRAGVRAAARPFVRRDSLAFALVRGFPIATGYLGKVPVPLLLDTGAATNQLDVALCQALAPGTRPVLSGTERNTGADGHHQLTQRGTLPYLLLGANTWHDLPMQVVPLVAPAGRALAYRGLLGYPFLSQDKLVSFHYGRRQFFSLTPKQR
jgi:predicted aspartyl protease